MKLKTDKEFIMLEGRYDGSAYRVPVVLSPDVDQLVEGQWLSPKKGPLGETVYAPAKASDKSAFIAVGSMRAGRNPLAGAATKALSILVGPFILNTRVFNSNEAFEAGDPLTCKDGGILSKATDSDRIDAYVFDGPGTDGFLRIRSK